VSDRTKLFNLLIRAWDVESKAAAGYSGAAATVRPLIRSQLAPIGRRDLEGLGRGSTRYDSILRARYLYLPLPEEGTQLLPVVGFRCGAGDPPAVVRLWCALFLVGSSATWPKLEAIGFRFESPEQWPRHGYFHAQPFIQMRSGKKGPSHDLPNAPLWMATDTPAFPLLARDGASLFSNLLLSLYGPDLVLRDYGPAAVGSVLASHPAGKVVRRTGP
jgi:hypothetical protein